MYQIFEYQLRKKYGMQTFELFLNADIWYCT